MKRFLLLPSLLLLILSACSGSSESDETTGAADSLFTLTQQALKTYTDSLRIASDSASISSASTGLEERLKEINEKFPLKTDTQLSEGRQDTIIMLTDEYLRVLDSRLHPKSEPDTIDAEKQR